MFPGAYGGASQPSPKVPAMPYTAETIHHPSGRTGRDRTRTPIALAIAAAILVGLSVGQAGTRAGWPVDGGHPPLAAPAPQR